MTCDQILSSARRNFEIPYERVERAVLDGGMSNVTLPTLTLWASGKKKRFDFIQSMWRKDKTQLTYAKELLASVLPGRMGFRRL